MLYEELVERRRNLRIHGFRTLSDVGFDGPWVTPYQISSASPDGPVLLALHWLDEAAINANRSTLKGLGYLPHLRFNKVLDIVLEMLRLSRADIYVTQAFHLIPHTRSQSTKKRDLAKSFDAVTKHELTGRRVVALGASAAALCEDFGIRHVATCHPSRRGQGATNDGNARAIADAISNALR